MTESVETKTQDTQGAAGTPNQETFSRLEVAEMRLEMAHERIAFLENVVATGMAGGVTTVVRPKQRAGIRHTAKRVLDTKSGITYKSLGECGRTLAAEFGLVADRGGWVFYKIDTLAPGRFQKLD